MSSPLGLSSSYSLLPVTGSFTLPFTAYFAFLAGRVSYQRLKTKTFLGDSSPSDAAKTAGGKEYSPLLVAFRAQANFVEYVPWAILLSAIAEMNGANRKTLQWALSALFVSRVAHAELGLTRSGAVGVGRAIGFYGTMGVMSFLAGYSAWLVKGYWGL